HVLHPRAAFDDDEAVGLLDHHANQAAGRPEVVVQQRRKYHVLWFDDGHGPHWRHAVFELVPGRSISTGGAFDDAATLPLLGLGYPLRQGGNGKQRDTEKSRRNPPETRRTHV